MLRAHMRERERRAWPRPLIKHGTLRASMSKRGCLRRREKNSERLPTEPVTRPRPHVRTARVGPKGARSIYSVGSNVCARHSLWSPTPKGFRRTPPKKIRWLLRTAQAREVARTWPSYEMVRDTVQSFTRRYEMVRDTVTVHCVSLFFAADSLWGG